MSEFKIQKSVNGEYRYNLHGNNDEVILASEGYYSKSACLNGIESTKKNSQNIQSFIKKTSLDGRHYFFLKASNGQIIGSSVMYASAQGRDVGIEAVMRLAGNANVVDLTEKQ